MLRRSVLAALILITTNASAQAPAGVAEAGRWQGDARLLNAKLRAKTGAIPTELLFAPDGTVSGKIGDASIPATSPKRKSSGRVEYQLVVTGHVHRELDEAMNHLVIIVTLKPGASLDADFHLKTRFGFDTAMLVGHFDVKQAS